MESEELARRMDCVIGDMGHLIDELKGKPGRIGSFTDPVCWNCSRAHKFYLPNDQKAYYRPCKGWLETHTCEFAPGER